MTSQQQVLIVKCQLLMVRSMRFLLHIIFLGLVLLVAIEDFVVLATNAVINFLKKLHKQSKKFSLNTTRYVPVLSRFKFSTLNVPKKRQAKKRKSKPSDTFSYPSRLKMKYFAFG